MVERETNLPRAVLLGVVVVIAVYLLANIAYLRVLGIAGLAAAPAPAAAVMARVLGPGGRLVVSGGLVLPPIWLLDLVARVTPRAVQASAADGPIVRPRAAHH